MGPVLSEPSCNNQPDAERSTKCVLLIQIYIMNYMAQTAIEKAQEGDYSEVDRLLKIMHKPYDEHPDAEEYADFPQIGPRHFRQLFVLRDDC